MRRAAALERGGHAAAFVGHDQTRTTECGAAASAAVGGAIAKSCPRPLPDAAEAAAPHFTVVAHDGGGMAAALQGRPPSVTLSRV
jgi:hypothetical protein